MAGCAYLYFFDAFFCHRDRSCLAQKLRRMAVAFRPLQPCLSLLLHRSSAARHACLRVRSAQLPIRCKIKHALRSDSSKVRSYSQGSALRASSSDGTEQILGLARQAIPQIFAPQSVVCSLFSTHRNTVARYLTVSDRLPATQLTDKLHCSCLICRLT